MNRNMSHSVICNSGRSNFEFVVTQLTDKSPNFTEPENSELHSQKFANGPHPKQVEPSPHFHKECIKHKFYMQSSHLHQGLPNGLSIREFPDHIMYAFLTFPRDMGDPPLPS